MHSFRRVFFFCSGACVSGPYIYFLCPWGRLFLLFTAPLRMKSFQVIKNDDCKTIAFVTYEIQADSLCHLPFFRLPDPFFISDSGVCRSPDFYIQMQSFQLHQRTHLAFSPGHGSPSNDRLSPYADYPAQKRYFVITATKEACIFASMHLAAAPTCPGISPDSLVQQGTRMRVRSVIASSGRAFATKAILIFSLLQTKTDCLLRQSVHSRNIPASRVCFRSVPLRKSPPL